MKKFLMVLLLILGCGAAGFAGFWLAKHKMTVPVDVQTEATGSPTFAPVGDTPASPGAAGLDGDDDDELADVTEISFTASGDNLIHSYLYKQAAARAQSSDSDDGDKTDGSNADTVVTAADNTGTGETEGDTHISGTGEYDFSFVYDQVADYFGRTDLNWVNQETLVSDTIEPSSYPRFSSPGDVVRELYNRNFRIFNISTNHSYDQGAEGLVATNKFWNSMPEDCLATGLVKKNNYDNIWIKSVKNVNFAFLSYTYGTNGLSVPSDSKYHIVLLSETDVIKQQIKLARELADVVVVSCHWGTEDSHTITESQRYMARKMTGWGADLIIGTHPHVVQDAEWVESHGRKAFCAYSLGNFVSGQEVADNLIGATLSLIFEVHENLLTDEKTVEIKNPKLLPTVTDYRPGHEDIRVYWLRHYSRELADTHGVRSMDSRFNYDYIYEVLKNTIDKEFLKLPKKKKK